MAVAKWWWVIAVVALAAGLAPEARADAACDKRVGVMRKRLAAVAGDSRGEMMMAIRGLEVPRVKKPRGLDLRAPVLAVWKDAMTLNGSPVTSYVEIIEGASGRVLYLQADGALPVAGVAKLLKDLAAKRQLRLVVSGPPPAPQLPFPDSPAWAVEELEVARAATDDRARLLANAITKAITGCAPLIEAFGQVASADPGSKADLLNRKVPAAIATCNCQGADVGAVELLVAAVVARTSSLGWLALPASALARAKGKTISDLAVKLK